jgi:aminoglycoside phosphotransferase (APT) family kinase protein
MHELHDLLDERKPSQEVVRLVHGDYGFHNCLVASSGDTAAVVDWEVATLGVALSDLAFVLNRWSTPAHPLPGRAVMATGIPERDEILERYVAVTQADLGDLPYYLTFNHWRSACIAHGVYTRYVRGQRSSEGVDVEGFRRSVDARIDEAVQAAAAL